MLQVLLAVVLESVVAEAFGVALVGHGGMIRSVSMSSRSSGTAVPEMVVMRCIENRLFQWPDFAFEQNSLDRTCGLSAPFARSLLHSRHKSPHFKKLPHELINFLGIRTAAERDSARPVWMDLFWILTLIIRHGAYDGEHTPEVLVGVLLNNFAIRCELA
ncbi:MAG: hypothetical protein U0992_15075 [Planctomycetaceae bacterium]